MDYLKKFVKSGLNLAGLDISRLEPEKPSSLLHHRIDLLLDVGANVGQYAISHRQGGYSNRIVSFEPLSEAHAKLSKAAGNDTNWIVHERCAVGAAHGETEINIAKNSYSSSLLPMLAAHTNAAPDSVYVGKDIVKVIPIDSVFNAYRRKDERVFLKIDTQGFEKPVLEGASACLEQVFGVQLELSITPLYASQELYEYFFDFFKHNGFVLWSVVPGFVDSRTGQMLQFDGIFVRPPSVAI